MNGATPMDPTTYGVLEEVAAERLRQDAKFGVVDVPVLTPHYPTRPGTLMAFYGVRREHLAKEVSQAAFAQGNGSWGHILVEELAEVLEAALTSDDAARGELVQLAAVAVAAVEALDRKAGRR